MKSIIYSTAASILLSAVDAIRIRITWGKKQNINHWVSFGLAIIFGVGAYLLQQELVWRFSILFTGIHLLAYAPVLNLFRGRNIAYISTKSSSKIDQHISYVAQRIIGVGLIVLTFLI